MFNRTHKRRWSLAAAVIAAIGGATLAWTAGAQSIDVLEDLELKASKANGVGNPIVFEPGGVPPASLATHIYSDGSSLEVDGSIGVVSAFGTYQLESPFSGLGTVLKYGDEKFLANSDNLALTNPAASGDIRFMTSPEGGGINEETRMTIAGRTGNVGIGTTSPDSLLHVAGELRVTGGDIVRENDNGQLRVLITDTGLGGDAGFARLDGPNGTNVLMTNVSGFPDHGSISVHDGNTSQAFMSVDVNGDGNVQADYMRVSSQSSPPAGASSNGSLYYDSSGALCARVSGAWVKLAGGGSCN